MALQDALKTLADNGPEQFKQRMQAVADANAEISALETKLGLPHSLPSMNPSRVRAKLEKLRAQAAAADIASAPQAPTVPAASLPVPAVAAPQRKFRATGIETIDAVVKASGCWCLEQRNLKVRRAELVSMVDQSKPESLDGQVARSNLAEVETELKRYE